MSLCVTDCPCSCFALEIAGHYQAVTVDPDTWKLLLDGQRFGKRLRSYHPEHPRSKDDGDSLYLPKLEVQFLLEYDDKGPVPWHAYDMIRDELREAGLNALHWSGLPTSPTEVDATETFIEDAYFVPDIAEDPADLRSNPIPALKETTENHVEAEFARTNLGEVEKQVLYALTDGGERHHEDLADEAGASSSTVYRLVSKLASLVEADDGVISFADQVTREHVSGILETVRETAEWASKSIRQVIDEVDVLETGDGPLARWMQRHGIRLIEDHPELHFEFGRPLSEMDVIELLRSGYQAAWASGVLTERFLEARFSWHQRGEGERQRWRGFPRGGHNRKILGIDPLDA